VTVIGAPPVLLRVMFLVAAEVPTVVPLKVRDVGDRAATGTVPEPLSVTFWGEPVALSAMAKAAERAPEALGVKVTVMAHIPLAATLVPQLLVWEYEVAPVPERVIAVAARVSGAVPELVRVTCWVAALVPTGVPEKVRLVDEKLTAGAKPVPASAAWSGNPPVVPAIFNVAERWPPAVGLKVTETVQVAFAARVVPQVVVLENEVALVPEMLMAVLASARAALPVLLRVTD